MGRKRVLGVSGCSEEEEDIMCFQYEEEEIEMEEDMADDGGAPGSMDEHCEDCLSMRKQWMYKNAC